MSDKKVTISVKGVSKNDYIYDNTEDQLNKDLQPKIYSLWGEKKSYCRDFSPIKNLSFDIRQGQAAAIVGRNDPVKSSLMKLIAVTLPANSGTIEVKCQIAELPDQANANALIPIDNQVACNSYVIRKSKDFLELVDIGIEHG